MLSAKSKPYIDASVPVLREHGLAITAAFYQNMFEAHPELKNLFNMGNQANGSQQQSLAAAVFAYAANIENTAALAPVIERIVHKHVSVGIKAEHYPIVGKHLLGAIKQILGNAATADLLDAWAEAYGLLADALMVAEAKLYQQNNQQPDEWLKVKVLEKIHHTNDMVSFILQADNGSELPKFKAGQYISVAVQLAESNLRQIRQYSLSDASDKHTYRITVKRENADEYKPKGNVSNWLHTYVKVGGILEVSHPCGNFTPNLLEKRPIGLISAGVGITPMLSILNALALTNQNRPVLFAHAARSQNHIAHFAEILNTKTLLTYAELAFFLNEVDDTRSHQIKGRMNLGKCVPATYQDAVFYICGPQVFMDEQRDVLLALGIKASDIHREVFGPESLNHII
ncbi:globin domain-containing protein [Methylophilus aquaticus]|uniref:nitric oxide dioxygenase n=2 Tax=Methylophilus aquaticus TaxID=1971610 RepID=A0ABT9JPU5_9PROT|nr:globin domain-containing protein [Methylophilus aquaticus]